MTAAELLAHRRALGLSQPQLARALGLKGDNGARTVRRWESGDQAITGPVALAVRFLANRCEGCPVRDAGSPPNPA